MKAGMLWFDNEKKTVLEKLSGAAQGFIAKYGYDHLPTEVHVHPATLGNQPAGRTFFIMTFTPQQTIEVDPVTDEWVGMDDDQEELILEVITSNSVLTNHFWIGPVPEKKEEVDLT